MQCNREINIYHEEQEDHEDKYCIIFLLHVLHELHELHGKKYIFNIIKR
jgi:hypothetical protein